MANEEGEVEVEVVRGRRMADDRWPGIVRVAVQNRFLQRNTDTKNDDQQQADANRQSAARSQQHADTDTDTGTDTDTDTDTDTGTDTYTDTGTDTGTDTDTDMEISRDEWGGQWLCVHV